MGSGESSTSKKPQPTTDTTPGSTLEHHGRVSSPPTLAPTPSSSQQPTTTSEIWSNFNRKSDSIAERNRALFEKYHVDIEICPYFRVLLAMPDLFGSNLLHMLTRPKGTDGVTMNLGYLPAFFSKKQDRNTSEFSLMWETTRNLSLLASVEKPSSLVLNWRVNGLMQVQRYFFLSFLASSRQPFLCFTFVVF
jgi:hypothetical protein